jgi:S1-C subfamily serine protease
MRLALMLTWLSVTASPIALARAQTSATGPKEARDLVLALESNFVAPIDSVLTPHQELGAAVIIGVDSTRVYLATAKHVVFWRGLAVEVTARSFEDSTTRIPATIADTVPNLDLAVIIIPRRALARLPAMDRRGSSRALRYNEPVTPMGCPRGSCWGVPAPPDRVVGVDPQGIIFQSVFVNPGSSGGALFNEYWEVAGLITNDNPPRANALAIEDVVKQVRALKHPVSLRPPNVPRAGYSIHFGASVLVGLGAMSEELVPESRFPSGRLVATRRGQHYDITWHVSALRLAPRNLLGTAVLGGLGVDFRWGIITAQPFAEVGLGWVEGRHDLGGYWVGTEYVPYLRSERENGLAAGGGMSFLATIAPHTTLEILAAHWAFKEPIGVPDFPGLFVGGGLRWGL